MGLSNREFARRERCDEKTVRKAIERGFLPTLADGSLDESLVGTDWRRRKKSTADPAEVRTKSAKGENLLSFADAQARKENFLAKIRQLEFEEKSGRLVDGEAVKKRAFEWERETRDYWANWPALVAAEMAAELGCEQIKLVIILERLVRKHLAERSAKAFRLAAG